ncbi:MAG: RHS repeat protein [Chloroflexi bacterium]|nr:RHS repeat protein [Chloroflexota bacterium]
MKNITLALQTLTILLLCAFLAATATPGAQIQTKGGPVVPAAQAKTAFDEPAPVEMPATQMEQAAVAVTTITYTYDANGWLVRADYGNGRAIAYTYDAGGNLTARAVVVGSRVLLPMVRK